MDTIEIILLLVAGALVVPIVIIFARHIPEIVAIQVAELPEEKQQKIKAVMAEARLQRKFQKFFAVIKHASKPLISLFKTITDHWRERIKELEKQYKIERLTLKSATKSGQESLRFKVEQLLKQAKEHHDAEDYSQAEEYYIQVVQLDPQSVDAFLGLGDVYRTQKKYDQAREVYHYILKMMKDLDASAIHLSVISDKQSPEERKQILAAERARIYWSLAEAYKLEDNLSAAERELDRAVELEPSNPRYLDALIDISIMKKDKNKAQDLFFRLKDVNPENKKLLQIEEKIAEL